MSDVVGLYPVVIAVLAVLMLAGGLRFTVSQLRRAPEKRRRGLSVRYKRYFET